MIYRVDISPAAKEELIIYVEGGIEFGEDIPEKILDAFDKVIDTLEENPYSGVSDLPYLPAKYRASHLWNHYWLIYQIYEKEQCVKIDYVIDDRQNYIRFIH